ncbi:MAG TPA: ankyrin repeat domain-containing protein [Abditibacterium sp.]|jgi:serine/threonine-protein phosphatase 6 regulatory ankyrin repeat subunit A
MELIGAIAANDENRVRELLAEGEDVNQTDKRGMTPLIRAAFGDKRDLVRLFIEAGADVNAVGPHGVTPIFQVAAHGDVENVELLLRCGADARHKNERGEGVLHGLESQNLAVRFALLSLLIAAGANPNSSNNYGHPDLFAPFIYYLGERDTFHSQQIFDLLDQHNFDFRRVVDGQNLLHLAGHYNCLDGARLLVERQIIDIESRGELGKTALHLATGQNHDGMIRFLISVGADIEARDAKGQTPIFMAEDLPFWKERGANINARDNQGKTVLMHCCSLPNAPRPVDTNRMSPESAAQHQMSQVMFQAKVEKAVTKTRQLLQLGADASVRDNQGFSALDFAVQSQQETLISLLQ